MSQWVLFSLALSCFVSFGWAMRCFFTQPEPTRSLGLQLIYIFGTVFSLVHLGAIYLFYKANLVTAVSSALLYGVSLSLFWWTIQVNRTKALSLAFSEDSPEHLVQQEPYRIIRHLFYISYTLTWLAGFICVPSAILLASVITMFTISYLAACQEEKKFAAGILAASYQQYRRQVGMFFSKLLLWLK